MGDECDDGDDYRDDGDDESDDSDDDESQMRNRNVFILTYLFASLPPTDNRTAPFTPSNGRLKTFPSMTSRRYFSRL